MKTNRYIRKVVDLSKQIGFKCKYSGISLRRTHHKADTLYKADRDFAPNLFFSGQTLLNVISIKRTIP